MTDLVALQQHSTNGHFLSYLEARLEKYLSFIRTQRRELHFEPRYVEAFWNELVRETQSFPVILTHFYYLRPFLPHLWVPRSSCSLVKPRLWISRFTISSKPSHFLFNLTMIPGQRCVADPCWIQIRTLVHDSGVISLSGGTNGRYQLLGLSSKSGSPSIAMVWTPVTTSPVTMRSSNFAKALGPTSAPFNGSSLTLKIQGGGRRIICVAFKIL